MKNPGSIRARLAAHYRDAIRKGELPEGTVLPPARALAAEWRTAEGNVHCAMQQLVREGLIARQPRSGSVVIAPAGKIDCIGLYLPWRHLQRGEMFTRILVETIEKKLRLRSIRCRIIYDTPGGHGAEELSALAGEREIQGVIFRAETPQSAELSARLPVPFMACTERRIANKVSLFTPEVAQLLCRALEGAKRIGVMSSAELTEFLPILAAEAARCGMVLDEECVYSPVNAGGDIMDSPGFAGRGFEFLLRRRPDGMILLSDDLVPGTTMMLYRHRMQVPEAMKFAVHATAENPVIYPFPCGVVLQRIEELAEALIANLLELCAGRPVKPYCLHARLERREGF